MLLTQGFKAYTAGDLAAAEKIFREITERFPDSADGQNNLGFVLLSKGDAEAGKRAFLRARELGYSRLEVSDANIAAADYVLGDFSAAGALFQGCLKQYSAPGGSTLLGLGPRGLFPVSVSSASGYVALMNLNSAWCALHLGDSAAAVRHLEVAKALEQELGAGAMSEELARSMSVLESELRGPR